MKVKVNIYTGNHTNKGGLDDILDILITVFSNRKIKVIVSDTLHVDSINIIVEEFTDRYSNRYIESFRINNPETKIVFVLTEFFTKKFGVRSFNLFGNIFDCSVVAVFNAIIKLKRKELGFVSFYEWIQFCIFLPIFFCSIMFHYIFGGFSTEKKGFLKKYYNLAYMKLRELGFKKNFPFSTAVILLHPAILHGLKGMQTTHTLGVIYPELNLAKLKSDLLVEKRAFFEMTGTVTSYRKRWLSKVYREIYINGLRKHIHDYRVEGFESTEGRGDVGSDAAFSLHPPQSYLWGHSSPTRIYRAIGRNNNIPVVTKVFNDHPIENVALLFNGVETLDKLIDMHNNKVNLDQYIEEKVVPYVRCSERLNNTLVEKILNL